MPLLSNMELDRHLIGGLVAGKKWASGSGAMTTGVASPGHNFTVTGLNFRPSTIIVRSNYLTALNQHIYSSVGSSAAPTGADTLNKAEERSDALNSTVTGNGFTINNDGFSVRIETNATLAQTVYWIAFE